MKKFEINENDVKAAFDAAKTDEMKNVLKALFCKRTDAPSLDDHTTIHSYEDALEALGEKSPNLEEMEKAGVPKHIIALIKLETISRALWGRTFQPTPDAEGDNWYYYPWFALWTKEEIEDRKDEFLKNGALLSGTADAGARAGFGYLTARHLSSDAYADRGFRLCQENETKAKYFGKEFIKLWAKYLAFNFTVGDNYFNE